MQKKIKKTEYLYGVKALELPDITEGLKARIEACDELLKKLVDEDNMSDMIRINDVLTAKLWLEAMIREAENG